MHTTIESSTRRALLLCSSLLAACAGSNKSTLRLTPIDASVKRPSNIAVYFTVETSEGEPVAGLTADSFRIYEDGQAVSVLESMQTILNPEMSAAHYTLLLIDMSGSVTESGDLPIVVDAARAFAQRVEKYQKVAVYAFDGRRDVHAISGFSTGPSLQSGIDRLASFEARDPSTNLNGAIVDALGVLERQMRSSSLPLTFGTLVVFTDGTDRAHRVSREEVYAALGETNASVLVIGVGAEIDGGELSRLGKDGTIVNKDRTQIAAAFDDAAARVEAWSRRYYLLGYCSPARAGSHEVTIEATWNGRTGSLSYPFEARGFGPNCDPTTKPSFSLRRTEPRKTRQPATKPTGERGDGSHF